MLEMASQITLLKDGVAAAKAGDRARARSLLAKVIESDPNNEQAWFWSAYVADSTEDMISSLRRVLQINPSQSRARSILKNVLMQEGMAAAKAGDQKRARGLLIEASELDPENESVWLWLSSVAETAQEAASYLRRALKINPNNERARAWLAKIEPEPEPLAWRCPFCRTAHPQKVQKCMACKAILTLESPDAIMKNEAVNEKIMLRAIERYESSGGEEFDRRLNLGLAYLNLKRFDQAQKHLKAASQLRPDDESLQRFLAALEQQFRAEQILQAKPAPAAQAKPQAAKREQSRGIILIIDDSPTVLKIVGVTLERHGYQVMVASGAIEALAKLNEALPDLILLDITMPNVDGYQLCKLLRANDKTRDIPIIMLTGKDGFFDKMRGKITGATEYITKPFEPATLLEAVAKHCKPKPKRIWP
jgi:twitching motility two-component system response regulator PilG